MGKKNKSKSRLDKFYRIAKQQGYRSRAAFKLIQLNKKYSFLQSSRTLVDLCAAPGGWLQVAEKFMPPQSHIIGIDLDYIKHIRGCKTFQQDITSTKCVQILKKQLKGEKADVFLNDGAPNVGANWRKDAYNQNQLVLQALKLTTKFLKKGGYFITKVFRSTDYNSLIWVLKKFFDKVQATKPPASRFTSAEIFIVCSGYIDPSYIDEKLLDGKQIFKDTEADMLKQHMQHEITSVQKILAKKRNRSGYDDDVPQHFYRQITLKQLMQRKNIFPIFLKYNKLTMSQQQKELYFKLAKPPQQIDLIAQDLKVLGKRQINSIVNWYKKVKIALFKQKQKEKVSQELPLQKDIQRDSDQELQKALIETQHGQIKSNRKRNKELQKQSARIKNLLVANVDNNQPLQNQNIQQLLQMDAINDLPYLSQDQQSEEQLQRKAEADSDQMQQEIDQFQQARRETLQKKSKRKLKADYDIVQYGKIRARQLQRQSEQSDEQDIIEEFKQEGNQGELFDNPLNIQEEEQMGVYKPSTQMQKRRKRLARNQSRKEQVQTKQEGIQIVPQKTLDQYTIQSLAQTMAIGRKLLRKKKRQQIINYTYNRYSREEQQNLPKWFVDNQNQHNFKQLPVTKAQINAEKQRLIALNARDPRKVLQAKLRKKKKVIQKMKKASQKAQGILGQQGVQQAWKMKQVKKMYNRQMKSGKPQKKYIVGQRTGNKVKRGMKYVDKRLKKDKKNISRLGKKIKKSKQRYNRRHWK